MTMKHKNAGIIFLSMAMILALGYQLTIRMVIPVQGASLSDWNKDTFWFAPWGKSGVHKGIDIFAKPATPVLSSSDGVVMFTGKLGNGGKAVAILGAGWRLHYYAHLQTINTKAGQWVNRSEMIGRVGNSGNAKDKPAHLHYSIITLLPHVWRLDTSVSQGWKKMFFLDPGEEILQYRSP